MSQPRFAVVVLLAVAIGGCSTPPPPEPVSTELPQLGLVGMWRVTAQGVEADTWLRLENGAAILAPDCELDGGWIATETEFAAAIMAWSGECTRGHAETAPWLTTATAYRSSGDGWELLADDGSVTATLEHDGWPEVRDNTDPALVEPPTVTDELIANYANPGTLTGGLVPATYLTIVGRWIPDTPPTRSAPYLRFTDDKKVAMSDGCNTSSSRWLITSGGALVTTGSMTTLVDCDGVDVTGALSEAVTAGIARDGSLHLIDETGTDIGVYVRER